MEPERRNAKLLVPRYDDLSLFLMSLAFVLLFLTQADLRAGTWELLFFDYSPSRYLCFAVFVLGLLYSLRHVFEARQKTDWEKKAMLFFAVAINGLSGVAAALHMQDRAPGLLVIFPIWNLVNGLLLLFVYRLGIVDESSLVDEEVSLPQIAVGTLVVSAAFILCSFVFELYWATTFSICVVYGSNGHRVVQRLLPRAKNGSWHYLH